MDRSLKIIGLTQGDPFDSHSWSGSNREIFGALRDQGSLAGAFDVDIYGIKRYGAIAKDFCLPMRRWKQNFLKSPTMFHWRSNRAQDIVERHRHGADVVLQVWATFEVRGKLPYACYLDSTACISANGGQYSFSGFADNHVIDAAIRREKSIYEGAALIFTMSDFAKRSLIDDYGIEGSKVRVVYAGPNMDVSGMRQRNPKSKSILFIGKDFSRKGGDDVLRAFESVRKQVPDAELNVVGGHEFVGKAGVKNHGFVSKNTVGGKALLEELFANAAVFVMPSYFEPFGIPFLEAMSHGVPCIGSTVGAMPEIIQDGKSGYLVEPGDVPALADRIVRILTTPGVGEEMGSVGLMRAQNMFSWDKTAMAITGDLAKQVMPSIRRTSMES
jgi:starch synthase